MSLVLFLVGSLMLTVGVFAFTGFAGRDAQERETADLYGMVFVLFGVGILATGLLGMLP